MTARHAARISIPTAILLVLSLVLGGCGEDDPTGPGDDRKAGQALLLDGDGGSVDRIGSLAEYRFVHASFQFTLEAWIRLEDPDADRLQVIVGNTHTRNESGFLFGFENRAGVAERALRVSLCDGDGTAIGTSYSPPNVITDTAWHHVAAVLEGASIRFYVDGNSLPGSGTLPGGRRITDASNTLRIGDLPVSGFPFLGRIDELRLWNRARAGDDIRADRARPLPAEIRDDPASGLRGYWRFDELRNLQIGEDGEANDVRDHSLRENNGTLAGEARLAPSGAF